MQLKEDLIDIVSITARFRFHPHGKSLRQAFELTNLDWSSLFMLTIDNKSPSHSQGIVVSGTEAYEFEFKTSTLALKRVSIATLEQDRVLANLLETLGDEAQRERIQARIDHLTQVIAHSNSLL